MRDQNSTPAPLCGAEWTNVPLRRVGSDEYTARVLYRSNGGRGVLEVENEVLGRVVVGERDRLLDRADLDDDALRDGLAHDVHTRQGTRLLVDLVLNRGDRAVLEIDRHEHNLRVYSVLCL